MEEIYLRKLEKREHIERIIIIAAVPVLLYLLVALYFAGHYQFHTQINGVTVSLKAEKAAEQVIRNFAAGYELLVTDGRDGTEKISGQDIELQYNEDTGIDIIYHKQNSLAWIISVFKEQNYYIPGLYVYNGTRLRDRVNGLQCLNRTAAESRNADFRYTEGTYELVKEVYGNKIAREEFYDSVKRYIKEGKTTLNAELFYEKPKYTVGSDKTLKTRTLLNKYVSTKITYRFGNKTEVLDGTAINKWLSVDDDLEVEINKTAAAGYIKALAKKYDTVGITRTFKTSIGKTIEVKGGLYGRKINQAEELKALIKHIRFGEVTEKEPVFTQKALHDDEDEIGNTYVEINITRQHLWFYKDGKLKVQGPVVTGNPNNGNATVVGTYMLNYKQKEATLKGPGYAVKVNYWMPFYGNMGIHDAGWRHAFGGEIYKRRGTHGCVNAPLFLAKTIFQYIEDGIPIVIYEE